MLQNVIRRRATASPMSYGLESRLSFNHDGLEVARVRRQRRYMPVWHVIFFIYLGLLIRLISMADLGPGAYENRMAELRDGSVIERVTASVMYMDPVSRSIALNLRRALRDFS